MAITGSTALRYIKHVLGDTTPSAELGAMSVLNQAGSWFYDTYDWRFKIRPPATCDITASQSYITLPTDFGEMVGQPHATSPNGFYVRMTTMADIARLRRVSQPSGFGFYAAIAYTATSGTTPPTPRLEIWPTQSTTTAGGLTLNYKACWAPVSDDDTTLSVPVYAEGLFLMVARAFAQGYEDHEVEAHESRLARIREGIVWRACELRDSGEQTEYGLGDPGPAAGDDIGLPNMDYVPITTP